MLNSVSDPAHSRLPESCQFSTFGNTAYPYRAPSPQSTPDTPDHSSSATWLVLMPSTMSNPTALQSWSMTTGQPVSLLMNHGVTWHSVTDTVSAVSTSGSRSLMQMSPFALRSRISSPSSTSASPVTLVNESVTAMAQAAPGDSPGDASAGSGGMPQSPSSVTRIDCALKCLKHCCGMMRFLPGQHCFSIPVPTANVAHGVNTGSAIRSSRAVAVFTARSMSASIGPVPTPAHTADVPYR